MFWLSSRYYSPELGRFIQPADISSLNPHSINGLNLYAYANNNPIGRAKSSVFANVGMISSLETNTILSTFKLPVVNYDASSRKEKWLDTDWPTFLSLSNDGFEVVNWSLSIYKGSLYFDHYENRSLYIAGGNISTYLEIGYDGRIIDANVEFLTIGVTLMYEDGTFEFGVGAGLVGYSVTIDIDEIIKIIFGG